MKLVPKSSPNSNLSHCARWAKCPTLIKNFYQEHTEVTEMTPMDRLTAPTEGMEVEVHPAGLTPAVAEITEADLEMTRTMIEGHPAVPIEAVETTEETHLLAVLTHPAMMRRTQIPTPRAPTPGIIVAAVGEAEVPMSD